MGIDYSARLFGIVFSDIRLKFLERHTNIRPCGLMPITARSKQVTRQHPGTSVARVF